MCLPHILLILCGDIETNPGPTRPDPKKVMEEKVNTHDDKIIALEKAMKKQKKMIETMSEEQENLQKSLEENKTEFDKSKEENRILGDELNTLQIELKEMNLKHVSHFPTLILSMIPLIFPQDNTLQGIDILNQQIENLKTQLSGSLTEMGSNNMDTGSKVRAMETALEELQVELSDKLLKKM